MRSMLLAVSIALLGGPCLADGTLTGPTEVGTTTMPAGQYYITEQVSHKSYSLTVTDKGNMILGPAPDGVAITTAVTAPVQAAGAVAASTATTAGSTIKGLMEKGVEKGMSQMVKSGAEKQLGNLLK